MDIKVLDSWLREYLDTKASAKEFAKYVSLSGPTVDRTTPKASPGRPHDYLYDIEVTTNRVDSMSIYGIAREAATILPVYGKKASLKPIPQYSGKLPKKGPKLTFKNDPKLVKRMMGVVITDIKNWKTPKWMVDRLESTGMRSLNSVVDITNYVMHEIGHPCHVFDYDKLPNQKIVVRESKKGEKITSFDNKEYTLSGGDIVFDDGDGNIIDLPGIIGTKNSVVTKKTKRVLFFFDTNSAKHIRKTSMELAIRTNAAVLNEKDVDPELAEVALKRGLILFEEICKAKISSPIYDTYSRKYQAKHIKTDLGFIHSVMGIELKKPYITQVLEALGFGVKWEKHNLDLTIPSFRATDMNMAEDIVEEIARIYGYQNLPSQIMTGAIPTYYPDDIFAKERQIKSELVKLGGSEVYTFSLVSGEMTSENSLKLSNPLGSDTEYLRDNLLTSIKSAVDDNAKRIDRFHIFELSNIYLPCKNDLPEEKPMLAGIIHGSEYFDAKGTMETLLDNLNVDWSAKLEDLTNYHRDTSICYYVGVDKVMEIGMLGPSKYFYYQADVTTLAKHTKNYPTFTPIPKFPAQIEDITITISNDKKVGLVFKKIKSAHENILKVELVDTYKRNFTFRVWYQDKNKTLTDKEVEKIRETILKV